MKEPWLLQLLALHLSKTQMLKMQIKGIEFAETTLHVGLGTFSPIMVEDLSKHKMESEQMMISKEASANN